jgi:hypothetical protein
LAKSTANLGSLELRETTGSVSWKCLDGRGKPLDLPAAVVRKRRAPPEIKKIASYSKLEWRGTPQPGHRIALSLLRCPKP